MNFAQQGLEGLWGEGGGEGCRVNEQVGGGEYTGKDYTNTEREQVT
jgi:hypothetical protein